MNQITAKPNTYDFGETFNYAVWPKNTTITLANVNWNNDYRDVIRFANQGALDAWIDSDPLNVDIEHMSQKKFQQMTLDINIPIDDAMQFNYLRAKNPLSPGKGASKRRNYYYFVLDYAYVAANNTRLTLQLDVWQTFIYDVQLGPCYVERGHIGIANENGFQNHGRDYLNVPEGLDVGGEYRIVKTVSRDVMGLDNYSVLVISAADLTKPPGTMKNPKLASAPGGMVDGLPSGASFYVFPSPQDFTKFMSLYGSYPWVTQAILSITMIPDVKRYHPGVTLTDIAPQIATALTIDLGVAKYDLGSIVIYGTRIDLGDGQYDLGSVTVPGDPVPAGFTMYKYPPTPSKPRDTALAPNWRDTFLNKLPAQYRKLKKFLTYPYSVIEVTTWAGQPLLVKPEAWADDDATIRELAVMVPPGQRIAFMPYRYNGDPSTTPNSTDDNAEALDFATTMSNFPSVPLVNNMAIGYLAANKNGLAFQFRSADWSQQRAMMGAQATEDVANSDIRNTSRQAIAGITASGAQAQLDAETTNNLGLVGGILGTVGVGADAGVSYGEGGGAHSASGVGSSMRGGAGASLNPLALAGYDATAGIKGNAIAQGAAIAQQQMGARAASSMKTAGEIRDTNVSLARRAARGDYANQIAGINAKIQDAWLNQPSTSGQFGGDALNIAHNKAEVSARWKLLDNSAVRRIGNFWLRYGYSVQEFMDIPSDFMCMTKFTYWKLSETYVKNARIPEGYKQTIRGIFEKGVTVWGSPADIGNIELADNGIKDGISY